VCTVLAALGVVRGTHLPDSRLDKVYDVMNSISKQS
jgi:hypothetical protein